MDHLVALALGVQVVSLAGVTVRVRWESRRGRVTVRVTVAGGGR